MTATLLKLRDYQRDCIAALHTKWDAGIWRPACVLPTGAGKTVVFAHLAEEFLIKNPGKRVLVLSHTDELVLQAASKMRLTSPHREIGIVKAERNEVHAQLISASVQSLRGKARRDKIRNVGLIIVDECHHAVAATYRAILEDFGALRPTVNTYERESEYLTEQWEPRCLVAGFTATLVRGDKEKLSDVWQDVAFKRDIAFMIRRGYLLDVRGRRVIVPDFDLRDVKMSGGDYREGSLGEALVEALAPEIVAKAYTEHAGERKGLGFAPTVDSAYAFAAAFVAEGIATAVVHGALARDERRKILADFRTGAVQVVWNCMVLTEGFDEPSADVVVVARPTTNAGLYQQMIGRVLRPDLTLKPEDRQPALILDVVGVSRKHNLMSLVDLSTRRDLDDREDLDEDLTLLELEDLTLLDDMEEGFSGGTADETYYVGPVDVEDFDPLARDSDRTWDKTPAGTYYLPAGTDAYVFLVDSLAGDPGTFDVVWCTKVSTGKPGEAGLTEHRGLSFEMALSWGEEESLLRGGLGTKTLTSRKARWRKDPATSGMIWKVLKTAGIRFGYDAAGLAVHPDGRTVTKGDCAEIIDGTIAAQRIDPLVRAVMSSVVRN